MDEERKSIDELLDQALATVLGAPDRRLDEAVDGAASLLAASVERWPAVSRSLLVLCDRSLGGLWARGWRRPTWPGWSAGSWPRSTRRC